MTLLRNVLIAIFVVIAAYTIAVISREGFNLIAVYLSDVMAVGWAGQFNLDFASYLLLSALWVAWRGGFSGQAKALGLVCLVSGMLVFAPLMLVLIARSQGDLRKLLLGVHA